MPRDSEAAKGENNRIVIIRGTGPKERPPAPVGLLKPPGANPNGDTQESSGPASEEG